MSRVSPSISNLYYELDTVPATFASFQPHRSHHVPKRYLPLNCDRIDKTPILSNILSEEAHMHLQCLRIPSIRRSRPSKVLWHEAPLFQNKGHDAASWPSTPNKPAPAVNPQVQVTRKCLTIGDPSSQAIDSVRTTPADPLETKPDSNRGNRKPYNPSSLGCSKYDEQPPEASKSWIRYEDIHADGIGNITRQWANL